MLVDEHIGDRLRMQDFYFLFFARTECKNLNFMGKGRLKHQIISKLSLNEHSTGQKIVCKFGEVN